MLEELGDLFEEVNCHDEAIASYKKASGMHQKTIAKEEALAEEGMDGGAFDEEGRQKPALDDVKLTCGLILQKLAKIYCNDNYTGINMDLSIQTFKDAYYLVQGVNVKQNIALMLQSLLTQVGREHELAPFKEFLPDANQSESLE